MIDSDGVQLVVFASLTLCSTELVLVVNSLRTRVKDESRDFSLVYIGI